MHEILRDKQVIFFDVGYTLDRPASGDWMFTGRFYALAGEVLKQRSREEIEQARAEGLVYLSAHHPADHAEELGKMAQYYAIINSALRLGLTQEELMDISRDRACNMDNYIAYPDAKAVLEALSPKFRLGIISDTSPSIDHQLTELDLLRYFSFRTYSFAVGAFKPDRRMYEDALAKCGCAAEDTVFIDDSPVNLAGAEAMGITPILIAANPASDVESPYLKIHSLSELLV